MALQAGKSVAGVRFESQCDKSLDYKGAWHWGHPFTDPLQAGVACGVKDSIFPQRRGAPGWRPSRLCVFVPAEGLKVAEADGLGAWEPMVISILKPAMLWISVDVEVSVVATTRKGGEGEHRGALCTSKVADAHSMCRWLRVTLG